MVEELGGIVKKTAPQPGGGNHARLPAAEPAVAARGNEVVEAVAGGPRNPPPRRGGGARGAPGDPQRGVGFEVRPAVLDEDDRIREWPRDAGAAEDLGGGGRRQCGKAETRRGIAADD